MIITTVYLFFPELTPLQNEVRTERGQNTTLIWRLFSHGNDNSTIVLTKHGRVIMDISYKRLVDGHFVQTQQLGKKIAYKRLQQDQLGIVITDVQREDGDMYTCYDKEHRTDSYPEIALIVQGII